MRRALARDATVIRHNLLFSRGAVAFGGAAHGAPAAPPHAHENRLEGVAVVGDRRHEVLVVPAEDRALALVAEARVRGLDEVGAAARADAGRSGPGLAAASVADTAAVAAALRGRAREWLVRSPQGEAGAKTFVGDYISYTASAAVASAALPRPRGRSR